MTPASMVLVTGANGIRGSIETTSWPLDGSKPEVLVQLNDGRQVFIPVAALRRQEDGSYALSLDPAELARQQAPGSGEATVEHIDIDDNKS